MKKDKKGPTIFRAPQFLDIYNSRNYEETIRFINSLEIIKLNSLRKVQISFVNTKDVKAAAMVVLYSRLEEILNSCDVEISINTGFNTHIKKRLEQTGFFHLCQYRFSANNFSQKKLPIISSKDGNFRDKIIDYIKEQIYKNNFEADLEYVYGDAVHEAINNVSLHAYKNGDNKWWLNCSLIDDELYLVLYDQGLGIPETFTKGNDAFDQIPWDDIEFQNEMQKLLKKWDMDIPIVDGKADIMQMTDINFAKQSHCMAIFFAMADDITRMTGDDELKHGQGSKSIKRLVSSHENGILWIFSNRGLYRYKNDDSPPWLKDYKQSINGTLIQWNIKVYK